MRTLDEIRAQFIANLIKENSPLTDFTSSSVNNTLIRSIGALQLEQDLLLENLKTQMFIESSDPVYLNDKLQDFGLTRKVATKSNGTVLVKPNVGSSLSINAVLTNTVNGNQYIVTEALNSVNTYGEVLFAIQSVSTGNTYNAPANTKLLYTTNPSLVVTIGFSRVDSNNVVGNLTGGSDTESNEAFISRFINTFTGARFSTTAAIKSFVLNQPNITAASIQNPFPGHLTVWFEAATVFTNANILNLKQSILQELPAGITFDLLTINRQFVDIHIVVNLNNNIDINKDVLINKLKSDISNWMKLLDVNQTFEPSFLLQYLNNINNNLIAYPKELTSIPALPDRLISLANTIITFEL